MSQDIWTQIDRVNWDALQLYRFELTGGALSPPQIFRYLVSPNEIIREKAFLEFHNVFSHQGGIVEGLYTAIPFLLKLLEDPDIQYKTEIIRLLATYAYYTEQLPDDEYLTEYPTLYKNIYQQLETSLDLFLQLLSLETGQSRIHLIRLIGYLNTKVEIIFFALIEVLQTTVNTDELIAIFGAFSDLVQGCPTLPQKFENTYYDLILQIINHKEYDWQLKLQSILNFIYTYKTKTPLEIEHHFISILASNEDDWIQSPSIDFFPFYYAKELGKERYINFLFTLAKHRFFFLEEMLRLIFSKYHTSLPAEEATIKNPLNDNERRFFEIIVDASSSFALDSWAKLYRIPSTKEEIKKLLIENENINRDE